MGNGYFYLASSAPGHGRSGGFVEGWEAPVADGSGGREALVDGGAEAVGRVALVDVGAEAGGREALVDGGAGAFVDGVGAGAAPFVAKANPNLLFA